MGYKQYCKDYENIENYEKAKADNFKNWDCHHRREAEFSRKELIALDMYYNVSSEELIFLTRAEHTKLHMKGNNYRLGKHLSEEHKKKLSEANKGKYAGENNPMYGKTHTEETRKKLSEALKGKSKSEETRKKMSDAKKGKYASEETRKKLSEAHKGKMKGTRWYSNGKINIRAKECPDGFTPGRLLK